MPTKSKTTKTTNTTNSGAGTPFGAFNVNLPIVEFPAVFRDFAENSAAQARDNYAKAKTAAEDATDMVEDTYETARQGAFAFGAKALDAAKVNSEASFSLARDLFGATTFAEIVELQSSFARKQLDVLGTQAKEFQVLTQKYVSDSTKQAEKTFKTFEATKAA
jgi:phasin